MFADLSGFSRNTLVPLPVRTSSIRNHLTQFSRKDSAGGHINLDSFRRKVEELGFRLGQICRINIWTGLNRPPALQVWFVTERTSDKNSFRKIDFNHELFIVRDSIFSELVNK
jgi:hypothetical protein